MLRRKSACFGFTLLLVYGVFGDLGGEPVWNNTSTLFPAENLPTTEKPTKVYDRIEEPDINVAEANVTTNEITDSGSTTWSVHDDDSNTTCIILRLEADISVPYVNTSQQEAIANLSIPKEAYASGSCMSGEPATNSQHILLSWGSSDPPILPNHTLRLEYTKNASEGADYVFTLTSVSLLVQPDSAHFPNTTSVDSIEAYNHSLNLHPTHANSSYRCNTVEVIDLPLNNTLRPAQVRLRNMQVEAFRSRSDNEFSRAVDCPADAVMNSDIVPIAVGCALAALVVVVLVAYLIGRRRARQRGYQSV